MKFEMNMKATLTTEEVKDLVAEACRRKMSEAFPGATIDGNFDVRAAYSYVPPINVEYTPKAEAVAVPEEVAA